MRFIVANILPEYPIDIKEKALDFLDTVKDDVSINLRTLIMVSKMIKSFPDTWQDLATYMVRE